MTKNTADTGATSAQTVKIASGKPDTVTKKNSELLFNIATKEFVLVPGSQVGMINNEVKSFDAFKPYMNDFFPESSGNEKLQAAHIKAAIFYLEKFVQAADDKEAKKILAELPQKIPEKTKEILNSGNSFNPSSLKNGDVVRYLRFRENRTVCLRKPRGKMLKKTYKLDEKDLNLELKKRKERAKNKQEPAVPISQRKKDSVSLIRKAINKAQKQESAESTIFEKTFWDASDQLYKLVDQNFFEDIDQFDAGINAEVLRVASDAKFGSTFDLLNKNIKIGGKANASVSLFQSKGHFNIYLPSFSGFDLVALLRKIDPRIVQADAKPIRLMLEIGLKGEVFAGVCASIGAEAGVQLRSTGTTGEKKDEAKFEAGVELFAGAKASANVSISAQMKLIKDEKTLQQSAKWETIGIINYGGYGAVGLGADLSFTLGYWDGRFRMAARIGLVVKAGAGTHISFGIDPVNLGKLVYTICVSLDFTGMSKVFDEVMQEFYHSLMLNCFYTGQKIADVSQELVMELERYGGSVKKRAETTLSVFKSIDDTFDEYIPGYTGYKQYNTTFVLLKDTYNYLKRENEKDKRRENAIRSVRAATEGNRWCVANWQIKANLIEDMCTGSAGWTRFTQEDKENAILDVVNTFRNATEAYKVDDYLKRRNKSIAVELDGDQLTNYRKKIAGLK
jgi:hypothetical protein